MKQLKNFLYAIQTVFSTFTGIGRSKHHRRQLDGLGYPHFIVAGILAAVAIVFALLGLVRAVTGQA